MFSPHLLRTWIRQSDRVDHPAIELRHSRRWRSVSALNTHRLRNQPAERVEINDVREFPAIGSGASSKQNRILKVYSRDGDSQRGRGHRYRAPPTRES